MNPTRLFIVGAPKCGTTALYNYLGKHPNVFFPKEKEPHFFAKDFPSHRTCSSWQDYQKLYKTAESHHQVIGDASVMMLYSKDAIDEILETYPDAQVLIALRNPVELVVSLHRQFLLSGRESEEDFAVAWQRELKADDSQRLLNYPKYGKLATYAKRITKNIAKDQFCFVYLEDLRTDPRFVYTELLNFLNLPDDGQTDFRVINEAREHRWPWLSRLVLDRPQIVSLLKRLRINLLLRHIGSRPATRKEIPPSLKAEITEYYRHEISLLAELTHRNLSDWLE